MSTGSTEPELNSYWFTSDHLVSLSLDKYGKVAVDFCSNQGARKEHSPSYVTEEQLRVEQKDQDLVRLDLVIMKLSSSAFVTNGSGVAIQHLEIDRREIREPPLKREQGRGQYMAFGEVFVDQRRTGFGTPYKFNAKELDCESGFYYYGARYYAPQFGRFLTVDPLASDFPSQSSYLYAYNNPVRMIDVDGLYGDENEANRQRDLAQAQGHKVVGDVYKSGDEWMFNTMEGDAFTGRFDNDFSRNSAKSFASGIIEKLIEQPIDAMLNVSTSIGGHLIDRARIILAEGPHEGPAFNEENDLSTPRLRFDFDNPNWVYQENNIETDMHTNEIARDQIKVLTSIPVGGLYGIPVKFGVNFLFQKSIEKGLNEKMKTP